MQERIKYLFDLCRIIETEVFFCGLTSDVQITAKADDAALITRLRAKLLNETDFTNLAYHDVLVRTSEIVNNKYFDNLSISNFRSWPELEPMNENRTMMPLPSASAEIRGIKLLDDFNDRYAFNERENYRSDYEGAKDLVKLGLDRLDTKIEAVMGDANA